MTKESKATGIKTWPEDDRPDKMGKYYKNLSTHRAHSSVLDSFR